MRLPHFCLALCLTANAVALAQEPQQLPAHDSPNEVFDLYRKSIAKQDWPTAFHCLTAAAQADAIFEAYVGCSMQAGGGSREKAATDLLKKFGTTSQAVDTELEKRLQQKYPQGAPPGSEDQQRSILVEVVTEAIADEPAFYDAVQKLLVDPKSPPKLGPLDNVELNGHRAQGRAPYTIYSYVSKNGGPVERQEHVSPKPFRFRKVEGSWFIE